MIAVEFIYTIFNYSNSYRFQNVSFKWEFWMQHRRKIGCIAIKGKYIILHTKDSSNIRIGIYASCFVVEEEN